MITREEMLELRTMIAQDLDRKVNLVVESRLDAWFNTNIKKIVDAELKEQFRKMMVIKFGE